MSIPNHPLKLLVVGSGGREHALCWKLAQSPHVEQIFCAPGNGGTATEQKTQNVAIDSMAFPALATFCLSNKIDLVVVGPDNPLAAGIVDFLEDKGLRVFGPKQASAQLESSKAYAKLFMTENNIPTPRYIICSSFAEAKENLAQNSWIRVVKVDGLALGKGVFVCNSNEEVLEALKEIFEAKKFGSAGTKVILEEKIIGEELSLLLLCDGKRFTPLAPSQDHKRRFDQDLGPNTGGMGAYSPVSLYNNQQTNIEKEILIPLSNALKNGSLSYKGILFVGIIVGTNNNVQVLEFNARFGDPETQAILPRLASDLLPALWASVEGTLDQISLSWTKEESCCVVAVTKTYPDKSASGDEIKLSTLPDQCFLFHAGTKLSAGKLVTSGGRILALTALGVDLSAAAEKAYDALKGINFNNIDYRHDIAAKEKMLCR